MEGNLFKWTNYWNGWQLRWFVLKDGLLSYYNTQNDCKTGSCKRSFKICMFEIIVNKNDNTRVDLILTNDLHLYLKASDYKERQKWLVALATQKATYPSNNLPQLYINPQLPPNIHQQQLPLKSNSHDDLVNPNDEKTFHSSTTTNSSSTPAAILQSNYQNLTSYDATNLLKIKQSELKLYCDLLTQQTYEIKNILLSVYLNVKHSNNSLTNENNNNDNTASNMSSSKDGEELNNDGNISESSSFKSDGTACTACTSQDINESMNTINEINNTTSNKDCPSNVNIDTIRKMDDVTSNINITCDMLIQIIRNLILLTNVSSNISPEAVNSLLNDSNATNSKSTLSNNSSGSDNISLSSYANYNLNLFHPLYLNHNLNQYKTPSSKPKKHSITSSELNNDDDSLVTLTNNNHPLTPTNNVINNHDNNQDLVDYNSSVSVSRKLSSTNSVEMYNGDKLNDSYNSSSHDRSSNYSTAKEDDIRYNFSKKINGTSTSYVKHLSNNLPNVHGFVKKQRSSIISNGSTSSATAIIPSRIKMKKKDLRNCQIESLKETHILVDLERKNSQNQSDLVDSNNNNINSQETVLIETSEKNLNEKMIRETETITETMTVISTSGPFASLTVVGQSHISTSLEYSIPTFFTVIHTKFKDVLSEYNGKEIETSRFLDCCSDVFSILDYFGSTAFLPVKIDVYGNINKIRTKYTTDPKKYHYLQGIVQSEINEKTTNVKNSATDALMWLRRAIWFLKEFMHEFTLRFNPDIGDCVNGAYNNTLKQYHNWVVRSIFSLAVRSVPTKEDFLKTLAINHDDFLNNKKAFEKQIVEEMKKTVNSIDLLIETIKKFYIEKNLDY